MDVLVTVVVFAAFLFSVIAHEVAHGWVAWKCGDPTARFMGRITANPIPHIDPWMSIGFPLLCWLGSGGAVMLGGAKPVPVVERNLRVWPRDAIFVALAGVTVNFAIAFACASIVVAVGTVYRPFVGSVLGEVLIRTTLLNLTLLVFNLVPIPPLDGSRVFRFLLSGETRRSYESLERYGMFLVLAFFLLGGNIVHDAVDLLASVLFAPLLQG